MPFIFNKHKLAIHYQWHYHNRGKNIVLINSLGTNLMIWNEVLPHITSKFNVLLFDKRGHGLSSTKEGNVSIDDYADDVIALMDELGIEKTNVLGLSIGGLITYSLASRYAERFEKLIFSNTGAKIGTVIAWNDRIQTIEKDGLTSMSGGIIERWLSPTYRQTNRAATAGYINMLERNTTLGYVQACAAIRDADYRFVLPTINHPSMFIGGSEDMGTTPEFVQSNAEELGAERVEILLGVGHLPAIEQPEKVAQLILEFSAFSTLAQENTDSYTRGMMTRRSVLGNTHVDRAEANKTDFDKDFQEYIVHSAWSAIWSRPGLSKRDRSLVTIALLTALGHEEELAMHIRATKNTGATEAEVKEVLLHTGVYAGVPVTNGAMKIAKKVYQKLNKNE